VDRAAIGDFEEHRLLLSRQGVFELNLTLDPVELRSWLTHSTQSAAWIFPCRSRIGDPLEQPLLPSRAHRRRHLGACAHRRQE
jgi:hypothetical protein